MDTALDHVWKALADTTRRHILDLLRDGPRTTVQLCQHFDMSRFGVMKHLDVLAGAGLVTVRRQGRERWNHLNAVPLRHIYERWVSAYEDRWATSLLTLGRIAERDRGDTSMQENQDGKGLSTFELAQEVAVEAPRERVWKALTADIGKWWAFRITDDSAAMHLDARLGGQLVEDRGDGEGALWGTVTYLRRGEEMRLTGPLGMADAPVNSLYTFTLAESEGTTLVKVAHRCFGVLDPAWAEMHAEGWKDLLQRYLKGYLEDGKTWQELKP